MIRTAAIGAITNPVQTLGLGRFRDFLSSDVIVIYTFAFLGRFDKAIAKTGRFDKSLAYSGRFDKVIDFEGNS